MYYAVQHTTRFRYSAPIVENVMEVRLQPRSDEFQQCLNFTLHLRPNARIFPFRDHLDNIIQFFSVTAAHRDLTITANSVVNVLSPPSLPDALPQSAWSAVDESAAASAYWEWVQPSNFTPASRALTELAIELELARTRDPLSTLQRLTRQLYETLAYEPGTTEVDSQIDEALEQRRGVCQDFSHIMLALVRHFLHMPCRYVSGYLYHGEDDRSTDDATHAWVEVLLPELGWVGFDPTNNLITGERHIRVAVGRDYGDVPPTHGFFRGSAESELSVAVQVKKTQATLPVPDEEPAPRYRYEEDLTENAQAQQQQQQQ